MKNLSKFRYLFIIAVIFLLINSIVFMIAGAVECVHGYIEFSRSVFEKSETPRPGMHLLEGLDFFVSALVFMIFGLGLGQLFLFNDKVTDFMPKGLRVTCLKELKIILWETILVALVIFCVTHLLRSDLRSWEILPFPILILVLAMALVLMRYEGPVKRNNEQTDDS